MNKCFICNHELYGKNVNGKDTTVCTRCSMTTVGYPEEQQDLVLNIQDVIPYAYRYLIEYLLPVFEKHFKNRTLKE